MDKPNENAKHYQNVSFLLRNTYNWETDEMVDEDDSFIDCANYLLSAYAESSQPIDCYSISSVYNKSFQEHLQMVSNTLEYKNICSTDDTKILEANFSDCHIANKNKRKKTTNLMKKKKKQRINKKVINDKCTNKKKKHKISKQTPDDEHIKNDNSGSISLNENASCTLNNSLNNNNTSCTENVISNSEPIVINSDDENTKSEEVIELTDGLNQIKYLDNYNPEILNQLFPGYSFNYFEYIQNNLSYKPKYQEITPLTFKYYEKLTVSDLMTAVLPGKWLTGCVINNYLFLIQHRSQGNVICFDTTFASSYLKIGYNNLPHWRKVVDIFSKEKLLIPLHINDNHWALVCIDFMSHQILYYDSLFVLEKNMINYLFTYLCEEYCFKNNGLKLDPADWTIVNGNSPKQSSNDDCGVCVCTNADFISRGKQSAFRYTDICLLRQKITYELLTQKLVHGLIE